MSEYQIGDQVTVHAPQCRFFGLNATIVGIRPGHHVYKYRLDGMDPWLFGDMELTPVGLQEEVA